VEADAGMLEQVLVNLAVNARDAMPGGGRITLSASMVELDAEPGAKNPDRRPGRFACLAVSDTGCGMDASTLNRIFEPFFTTKAAGRGTGLGLATVYGIVAQHRGWVDVESEVGRGTTFRIYLPAPEKEAPSREQSTSQPAAKGKETILVVEDDPDVLRMLGKALRSLGYQVIAARNGQEALTLWREHGQQIDLMITDLVMPEGMTGLELAGKVRAERPDLRVIISSGYSAELSHAQNPTADHILYLPKPYQLSKLGTAVRRCLDEQRPSQTAAGS
jgi:CheY-like chemotaxis protein